jgi:hypothetical protein
MNCSEKLLVKYHPEKNPLNDRRQLRQALQSYQAPQNYRFRQRRQLRRNQYYLL